MIHYQYEEVNKVNVTRSQNGLLEITHRSKRFGTRGQQLQPYSRQADHNHSRRLGSHEHLFPATQQLVTRSTGVPDLWSASLPEGNIGLWTKGALNYSSSATKERAT